MKRLTKIILRLIFIACTIGLAPTQAAVFNIPDGDVAGLIAAIKTSNTNNKPDTINLAPFGTYVLTTIESSLAGDNGLPMIQVDGSSTNDLKIFGNGSTLTRDAAAPKFRLMYCIGNTTIQDLTFTNGYLLDGSNGGGALLVNGQTYFISNCTFTGNRSGYSGGALLCETSSTTTVTNCTFQGNISPFSSAIEEHGVVLYVINSTISGNTCQGAANGGSALDNWQVTTDYVYLRNTIVSNNNNGPGGYDVGLGAIVLQGGNFIGSVSGNSATITPGTSAFGDYVGSTAAPLDAKLNALADNGGFTKTMSPQSTSPTIDKGSTLFNLAQDQRGYARVGTLDIGACEYGATAPSPVIATTGLNVPAGPIGTVLTISGINMIGVTQIKFQGAAAVTTGFTNNTATSVTVIVPAGTTTGKITVTTAKGTSALSTQPFTVGVAVPVIASAGLSVTSGPIGTLLTITGTGLTGITQIKFQGAAAVTTGFTNNTSTSVTVAVPADATSGKITVTTAGGTSALSTQSFTVILAPVISATGLSVTSGPIGTVLTITGTDFSNITKIDFQGASVTTGFTNNTATSVKVTVPAGATNGKITVTTAGGTSALSTQSFTVILTPVISATGLSATSGPIGTLLTITGTGFSNITKIDFQGAAVTTGFTNNTATSVTVAVPAGATSGQLTVTTAGGRSALSTQTFTILNTPVISSTGLSVTSGPIGTLLTITGINLSAVTKVDFQGVAVTTGFTNNTATSVTLTIPVGASSGQLTVTTADGTSALSAQSFTVTVATANANATLTDISFYPNPFENSITIETGKITDGTQAKIISTTGLIVKQVALNGFSTVVDMQAIESGVYIVHVSNESGESMNYRVIKK